ncbi:MAG: integration host factor subunit alpha [Rhodospirillales bacterium]|jgi:integration host factor subunit alpha|nr:integration host factor subunit alpha [Rhodospirillales bacterium]
MSEKTVTRTELSKAIHNEVGLPRSDCAELLDDVLKMISASLVNGEPFKVTSFGSFTVRHKGKRLGRNPKTGEEVMISPRRVIVFRPSLKLRQRVNR